MVTALLTLMMKTHQIKAHHHIREDDRRATSSVRGSGGRGHGRVTDVGASLKCGNSARYLFICHSALSPCFTLSLNCLKSQVLKIINAFSS